MVKIDYVCFTSHHGYATAAKDYILALLQGGYDVKISPLDVGYPKQIHPEDYKALNQLIEKPFDSSRVQVFHCIPDMTRRFRDKRCKRTVGMAVFETIDPPKPWIKILNMNDAVFVPSRFCFEVFKDAGIEKPLFYIPHCIDFSKFRPDENKKSTCPFRFLFFGSWKKRKGGLKVVEAFLQEFNTCDDVELVISGCQDNEVNTEVERMQKSFSGRKKLPPIIIQNKLIPANKLPEVFQKVDCLVSPTMGEGFYLPGLQAMACKVPLIITNWSGCIEYATEETATLLTPGKFVEIDFLDGIPQFRHKKWANVSPGKVAEKMRWVYENPEQSLQKAETGFQNIQNRFSYDAVLGKIEEVFKEMTWLR